MAIDPNIKKKADDIRNKIYGKEVRESLASGLEEISEDVVENESRQSVVEGRQDDVESQWQNVVDETTGKDVISAPEIIAARNGEPNLKARLDKENQEVASQLAQITLNVKDFGAVGDGITNDYQAIKSAADFINEHNTKNVKLLFPPGEYFLNEEYTGTNNITDIQFQHINGLILSGYGATITLNGNIEYFSGQTNRSLCGFRIEDCQNVVVEGFEINGNNQDTESNGLSERSAHGLYLASVYDVTLKDMYIHHMASDGLYIRESGYNNNPLRVSKNIYGVNLRSEYNGRQGMSIIQLYGGYFLNCQFNHTNEGVYNGHSPGTGVDIEPNRNINTPPPMTMDYNTGNIIFEKCEFIGNHGTSFTAHEYFNIERVILRDCLLDNTGSTRIGSTGFVLNANHSLVDNCVFIIPEGSIAFFGWGSSSVESEVNIKILNSYFYGEGELVRTADNGSIKTFKGNTFSWFEGVISKSVMLRLIGNVVFQDNTIFAPATCYDTNLSRQQVVNFTRVEAKNNVYNTDLTSSEDNRVFYFNDYDHNSDISDEKYNGTNPGEQDTFRPSVSSLFNTQYLYTNTDLNAGNSIRLGSGNQSRYISNSTTPPTEGSYRRGDIVFNVNARTVGDYVGWYCTQNGSPGTWLPFGKIEE